MADDRPFLHLSPPQQRQRLQELAVVFLRLGILAFGGPAAHVALMEDELVTRRQWMSREHLLDLMGITNLLPGPNSTELAIHIGYDRGGWRGLLLAGTCFIAPAMALVWILAAVYQRYQSLPQLDGLLYGIKPVIIAVVAQALWKLGRKALVDPLTLGTGVGAGLAYGLGYNEIGVLLVGGLGVMLWRRAKTAGFLGLLLPLGTLGGSGQPSTGVSTGVSTLDPTGTQIFLLFLKIGSVLYGSGYVLLAFLQRDLVERRGWLSSQQLLDAVAVGQLTPGPVSTTATFVGYLLGGHGGAIAATVGIFLPAFALVALVNPWVTVLQRSPWSRGFLDGINAASLGLMAGVTYTLGRSALVDGLTLGLALVSGLLVFRFKVNAAWLVLGGGAIGLGSQYWG
ncbi:chromate efflux transporter [Prochlorothrix hollandica]|uniref:Chromate transporter n=1 Tax=Prochlorothrix hollandica PCC 9006 = CALU 1027 TaxID=317619 RepID=A0A0M2PUW2_PROHO|nr:chromate efflux transporter [Prochlorothrix hollandica]KKI98181.1 chromate transporter [Prochlorothrix hollandica PCC 9006 = CALU 1027]